MQPSPPGTYVILVALVSSSWQTEVRGCYCIRTTELILTTWSLVFLTAHCWWSWALWRDECWSINLELIWMTRMYILPKLNQCVGGSTILHNRNYQSCRCIASYSGCILTASDLHPWKIGSDVSITPLNNGKWRHQTLCQISMGNADILVEWCTPITI